MTTNLQSSTSLNHRVWYWSVYISPIVGQNTNGVCIKDRNPILNIDELLIMWSKFFCEIDWRPGYHQIRVKPKDGHKTSFHRWHNILWCLLACSIHLAISHEPEIPIWFGRVCICFLRWHTTIRTLISHIEDLKIM